MRVHNHVLSRVSMCISWCFSRRVCRKGSERIEGRVNYCQLYLHITKTKLFTRGGRMSERAMK